MARVVIHHFRAARESEVDAARFIRKVLRELEFQARLHVATGPYTMGNLAHSIRSHGPFIEANGRVTGSVGSDLAYAASVEAGSGLWGPKHAKYPIYPVRKKMLRFYWRKVGKVVVLPKVSHPGQRGKGYLKRAAESVGRRHNMLVIIREL